MNLPATIRDAHPFYAYGIDLAATSAYLLVRSALACAEFDYVRSVKACAAADTLGRKSTLMLRLANEVRR
ncbi:MAG: hypothetical protein ACRCZP_19895 [Phycicoccus sp.]